MPERQFNISRWAIEQPTLSLYFLLVLLLAGLISYFQLGQDEDPPFTFRVMVITTHWPGATAMQMSQQVADKLERTLQEVPYVDRISTYSRPGESTSFLILKDSTPPDKVPWIWYTTRKKIQDMSNTLPQGVQGPWFNDEFGDVFGIMYTLSGDGFSMAALHDAADNIRQSLLRVPDVAKVELYGVQHEVLAVEASQKRLAVLGLNVNQLVSALGQQNAISDAGILHTSGDDLQIRVTGQLSGVDALSNLSLRANGRNFRLGDIARVRRTYESPAAPMVRSQGQPVIALGISMAKGGDIIHLGQALTQATQHIRRTLPAGLKLEQIESQPEAVAHSVGQFIEVLVEAVLIVLLVSFLSLGLQTRPLGIDIRPGLVVALTIPLVLALTFLVMNLSHINLHKVSLGSLIIALGLLVDDAIIVVEMMARKMDEGYPRLQASTAAYEQTAMPMLTGTLITAAGFLPIGLAHSSVGEYTFAIFAVTCAALLLSWMVSVYFVPFLGYHLLKNQAGPVHDVYNTRFYAGVRTLVTWCVDFKKTTLVLTLLALIAGMIGMRFVEQQFFPDSDRPEILVDLWLPEGSSQQATLQAARHLEKLLNHDPLVRNYTDFIGSGAPRFFLTINEQLPQTSLAEFIIRPYRFADRSALRQQLQNWGQTELTEARVRVKLLPNGPPVDYPVAFRVSGDDPLFVRGIADILKERLRHNPHLTGVNDNWNESVKALHLVVNQDRARALGVSSQSVAQAAHALLSGQVIGQFREGHHLLAIELRQPEEERNTFTALKSAYLPTDSGQTIPISQVARLQVGWEPGLIWRENKAFSITVQADVKDSMQPATISAAINRQLQDLRQLLKPGYRIDEAGTASESAKGQGSILVFVPLMLFLMFTLLILQLRSFGRALLAFVSGPLGIIGAAAALLLSHRPFGFVAMLGVIALNGMIIRNSVILIAQIEQDQEQGVSVRQAIIEAAIRRCRPILLTAAAAVLAMIPLAGSTFWGPMAIAIMGGLLIATALTLLSLPAAYALFFSAERSLKKPLQPVQGD